MTAADRLQAAAVSALVEAARAAAAADRVRVLGWLGAAEAALRLAEDARAVEVAP
jgi:hypothetical protein